MLSASYLGYVGINTASEKKLVSTHADLERDGIIEQTTYALTSTYTGETQKGKAEREGDNSIGVGSF